MSGITWEILDERFSYDPDTGILSVKEVRNSSASYGEEAGWNNGGYRRVSINGKHLLVHKVIWALYYKEKPPEYIDHEDGNGLNNRILNLRAATESQNMQNRGTPSHNTSGHKGVHWHKGTGRWTVKVSYNKRHYYGGYYVEIGRAIEEATKLRTQLHGAYANHN